MKPIRLVIGDPVPDERRVMRRRMKFWRLSYEGGPEYKDGKDAEDQPVLVPHEGESGDGIKRRKRLATYANFCGPICDRYTSMIYSKPIKRDQSDGGWVEFCDDADMGGTPLSKMMEDACALALAEGEHWLVMDSTREPDDSITVAQAEAAGDRPFLVDVDPRLVLAWRGLGTRVDQCLLSTGKGEARLYDADKVVVATIDEGGQVRSLTELPHDYGMNPCVRVTPLGGKSMIRDVAEANKLLFNLASILTEELQRQTWTQWVADGLDSKKLKSAVAGGRRIWCIPKGDADIKFTALKGDVSQADSIRETMKGVVNDVYRQAGVRMPDLEGQGPESGRALRIRQDEMAHFARSISLNMERADNQVLDLYEAIMDQESIEPTQYPYDFDSEDEERVLDMTLKVVASSLPLGIKKQFLREMARAINEEGDPALAAELEKEIEATGGEPPSPPPGA